MLQALSPFGRQNHGGCLTYPLPEEMQAGIPTQGVNVF